MQKGSMGIRKKGVYHEKKNYENWKKVVSLYAVNHIGMRRYGMRQHKGGR